MKINKYVYLTACLCTATLNVGAQQTEPLTAVSRLYQEGKQLFLREDYSAAQQMLTRYVKKEKVSEFRSEADYMIACTAYELKQHDALELLEQYLKKYPESRYENRVQGLLASIYFEREKYLESIANFKGCDFDFIAADERSEFIIRLATAYQKIGNLDEASFWFRVLRDSSRKYYADAQYNLAYIDYVKGRYDQALSVFQSLEDDEKFSALAPYYIADIYLIKGKYNQSKDLAVKYLKEYADHEHALEMGRILGESAYMMNDYAEAVPALEIYRDKAEKVSRETLYKLGMSYFHTKAFTKAAPTLGEVTTVEDALSQNAYLHMGLAYVQLMERNQARMAFEQAAAASFDIHVKEQALYNYALCIHETTYSPFAESVKVFERFVNEFPNSQYSARVNDYLVEVYMNTRSYEEALKSISKIAYPDRRILEAKQKLLMRVGTQSFAQGKFDEAVKNFSSSLELGQYNRQTKADAFYWRGESKYRQGQYASAGNDISQYLEFAEDKNSMEYGLALYNMGYIAFKLKKYDRALNWFRRCANSNAVTDKTVKADAYNRMGDCYFYNRQFTDAAQQYASASNVDPSFGDYSLFQEAFVKGLQRDYTGKIRTLNKLITDYPSSQYIDDALYEQGRAFVQIKDNVNAIARYSKLVEVYPESALARKASSEIGLLYYQDDAYDQAIEAYKKVISSYPGSEEARLAQRDLKSIYIDLNKVDDYVAFVSTIPGGANFDVNERDSLNYVAAERVYLNGNIAEAKKSFANYLQIFPEGAFSVNASFYMGLISYNDKEDKEAERYLSKVLEFPDSKFSVNAMSMSADIAYRNNEFDKALGLFKSLADKVTSPEEKMGAETGALRSACKANDHNEIVGTASALLSKNKLTPELENEARYYRAKSLMILGKESEAMEDLLTLAKDTRNVYGAEAKYQVAQIYFDKGETVKAEKEVLAYIEVSTPHAYWLARSFVLLSDVYVKLNKKLEAKQYLLSLKQNYQADDDIAGMIDSRLKVLNAEQK